MPKKLKMIKSTVIFSLLIFTVFAAINCPTSKSDPLYNANVIVDLEWDSAETQKPIIPRDEIKELDILIKFRIETGDTFGAGLLDGYIGDGKSIIDVSISETSPWCYAVLQRSRVVTNISAYEETRIKLYITLGETAPAYGDGFIKINITALKLGLIQGFNKEFTLSFSPSYVPIIRTNLPEVNTKRINPGEEAVFPIEIENAGNARTKVLFELKNVPEGWEAAISEEVILREAKGSKETAYLTIIPPRELGYHYDEANIKVVMTPVRAEDEADIGESLSATFTVQNRGLSTSGFEQMLFILIIVVIILLIVLFIFRKMRRSKGESST